MAYYRQLKESAMVARLKQKSLRNTRGDSRFIDRIPCLPIFLYLATVPHSKCGIFIKNFSGGRNVES
jgi:hypothetical protein